MCLLDTIFKVNLHASELLALPPWALETLEAVPALPVGTEQEPVY